MSITAAIRKMVDAGLTLDQALLAAEVFETVGPRDEQAERRREKDRTRKREKRLRNSADAAEFHASADTPHPPPLVSQTLPEPTPHSPPKGGSLPPKRRDDRAEIVREFHEVFWPAWPEKVGKDAALKAWPKARQIADLDEIMSGLEAYKRHKPPDRSWMNPGTFLNGKRWEDRPSEPTQRPRLIHDNGRPPPKEHPRDQLKRDFLGAPDVRPFPDHSIIDGQAYRTR